MNSNRPLTVGITGGIGAGKSIICEVFKSLGIKVYSADERAKELMEQDPALIKEIKNNLGTKSYINGELNRQYISKLAFEDKAKLELLNSTVHPHVLRDFSNWVDLNRNDKYLIKEAALLFETGSYKDLDSTVVVYCPLELRINRILLRDIHRTKESVLKIIDSQMSDTKKKRLADLIIVNDDTQLILPQILKVHNDLIRKIEG